MMWKDEVPERTTLYKHCLEFKEQYGDDANATCKKYDSMVQREFDKMQRQIDKATR